MSLKTLSFETNFNKEKCISGEAHFWEKLEGFNSDLVLVGLSRRTKQILSKKESTFSGRFLLAWGLQRDTFNQGGVLGRAQK